MTYFSADQVIPGAIVGLREFLTTWVGLAGLCSQNGWIDNDSLCFEVIGREKDAYIVSIQFEEIVMEGAGCVADRVSCFGRVGIDVDDVGRIIRAWIL